MAVIIRSRIVERVTPAIEAAARRGLSRAAIALVARIKSDTRKGIDADGAPFEAYKRSYRTKKMATGRDSGIVDLTLTGEMLRAMAPLRMDVGQRLRAVIGFTQEQHRVVTLAATGRSEATQKMAFTSIWRRGKSKRWQGRAVKERVAKRSNATIPMAKVVLGNMRTRKFFAVGERRKEWIAQIVAREIRSELRKPHT